MVSKVASRNLAVTAVAGAAAATGTMADDGGGLLLSG
jgi:hypothetical protein